VVFYSPEFLCEFDEVKTKAIVRHATKLSNFLAQLCCVSDIDLIRTVNEDLDLAEADEVVGTFSLHDEVSARRHARGARQVDSGS